MTLSLYLLPEFGWSVRDQPVFGPGSVFQGYVEIKLSKPLAMDRLRLVFQGQECLVPYDVAPGVVRAKQNSLFGVQQTLWESKDGLRSLDAQTHKFSFTLQMPMVQYPPSTDHPIYNCNFKLSAIVELLSPKRHSQSQQPTYKTVLFKEQTMLYMPFVETQLLKQPLLYTEHKSDLCVTSRLHSLCYVPGDSILGSLKVDYITASSSSKSSSSSSSSSSSKKPLDISLKLYRKTTNLEHKDVPTCTELVASMSKKLSPVCISTGSSSSPSVTYSSSLELDVPDNLVPTFTYSSLASVTYRLVLTVKRKGPLSMWAQEISKEWPLTIGTLGAGVRASSDLLMYTSITDEDDISQRPKFMKAIEYEDALPLYEPDRLPDYLPTSLIMTTPVL